MSEKKKKNNHKGKKAKKNPSKVARFFKVSFLTLFIIGLTCASLLGGYVYSIIKETPALDVVKMLNTSETSTMLRDGTDEFITNIITNVQRFKVTSDEIPQNLKNAYVAIEDERFYKHRGVDVKRVLGAQIINVKNILSGSSARQGGSSITQQLLKNTVLKGETGVTRKVKEMFLAIELENTLSKDEILTAYLNTIPLGGTVYGVEAAALHYFGKSAKDLTLPQCAYIAGITQSPGVLDAFTQANQKNPERYLKRVRTVLGKMKELGFITQEEYDNAINVNAETLAFHRLEGTQTMQYEYFTRPVVDQVRTDLQEKLKYTKEEANELLLNGGLTIYVTLDPKLQDSVQALLDDPANFKNAFSKDKNYVETVDENGVFDLQAAAAIIDYRTGQVKALVGGRGTQPQAGLNRAYDILKSIASTTKPLTVYSPAIDLKLLSPGSVLDDVNQYDEGSKFNIDNNPLPSNENRKYQGYLTLREGLRISNNVLATKTYYTVGKQNSIEYAKKFGLVLPKDPNKYNYSLYALGQYPNNTINSDGANVLSLAAAYGTFGNNGILTKPILYTKVLDSNGNILLDNTPNQTNVISPQTAYIVYDMLKGPITYSAGGARFGNIPVAGKTGTTTGNKDYLFAGLTPYYSGAVWMGYDRGDVGMSGGSGTNAATLWGKIMKAAHEGLGYKEIQSPGGITTQKVCKDSGMLATELCKEDPRGNRVSSDLFIKGTVPKELCTVHVKAKINKENGKLATENTPPDLVQEKVFITREPAFDDAKDAQYVLPTEEDDTIYVPPVIEPPVVEPSDNNNNSGNTSVNNNNGNNNNGAGGNSTPHTDNNTSE